MIQEGRSGGEQRDDLLSSLAGASEEAVGGYDVLTDMEVISEWSEW